MYKASILFENGDILYADVNLNNKTVLGEMVFNTSMTGYQEILTDPSYASQIVVMTYPLIGNYGISDKFSQSDKIQLSAFVIKENSETDIKGVKCLSDFLAERGVLCLSNIDTRRLTRLIRSQGSENCLITTETVTEKHKKMLKDYVFPKEIVRQISCKEVRKYSSKGKKAAKFAVIDYGIKKNIIQALCKFGAEVTVFPCDVSFQSLLNEGFDAVLLSNGPGNPKNVDCSNIKDLVGKIPIFGICLGNQILALVLGADTCKMKFGHRGGNHPVISTESGKVFITSQNHGYAIVENSVVNNMVITYKNVNDDTVEGFRHKTYFVEGVQFHPEAGPGPNDSEFIIEKWVKSVSREKTNA